MPKIGQFVMSVYREESPTVGKLIEALCAAWPEFTPVVLDKKGTRSGRTYRYASLNSIRRATGFALAKHGLFLNYVYCETDKGPCVTAILRHKDGEYQTSTLSVEQRDDMQDQDGVRTMLCRTAAKGLLSIICEDDEDDSPPLSDEERAKRSQWEPNLALALKAVSEAKTPADLDRYEAMAAERIKEGLLSPDAAGVIGARVLARAMELKASKEKSHADGARPVGDQGKDAAGGGGGAADHQERRTAGTGRGDIRSGSGRAPVASR